jgi:hypothetical protein
MAFLAIAAVLFGLLLLFSALNNQTITNYAKSVLKAKGASSGRA